MRYDKLYLQHKDERGSALVITLLFLVSIGVLSTALVFTVNNEMKTSTGYKYSQQAFYVANAGVQKGVQWFANSYTPHLPAGDYDVTTRPVQYSGNNVLLAGQTGSTSVYPESTVTSAFSTQFSNQSLQADTQNSGVYALNAQLVKYTPTTFLNTTTFTSTPSAMERWQLNSRGYWGTVAKPLGMAEITAMVENSGNAMFDRACWGIDSVDLKGTVKIDSYDPALGAYGGANIGNQGAIGSNGNVSLNGNVTIDGDAAYGPAATYSATGGATTTGNVIHLTEPHYFPPLPSFSVGTTGVDVKNKHPQTISQGSYGTISVDDVLTLNPGTYYIDQLTEGSNGQLKTTGPTTLFVKSGIDLSGQGVANVTGDPTQFTVYYSGASEFKMVGGTGFYGEVYAPNATVKFTGNSTFYGSFIGKTVTDTGTENVHFDEGCMKQNLIQRPFRLITWSQSVY